MSKAELRREMVAARESLPKEERLRAQELILKRVVERPEWERAKVVALYHPFRGEVDLLGLFKWAGKRTLLFPRVCGKTLRFCKVDSLKELTPGSFGIPEPSDSCVECPIEEIDLLLVPGVAYSERGYRLGYGGGYYDRVLAKKGCWQMAIGVAFSCQLLPEVPVEPWDRPVDLVLSEDRAIFPATSTWI